MQTHIRNASHEDMEEVTKIFNHYVINSVATFEEIPQPSVLWNQRLSDLSSSGYPFLIAEVAGEIAGYAYASPWRPKPAYRFTVEDSIYLAPEWVGRGIGKSLLTALIEKCIKLDFHQMIAVIADTGLESSRVLHRALGFSSVGQLTHVGYKHGKWVDTYLMQRTLSSATNNILKGGSDQE